MDSLPARHQRLLVISGLFALALVVRVIFVFQWNELPYARAPLLDAQVYDIWAQDIAHGNWLRGKAFYQSPLYPYFCGLLYAVFGHGALVIGLFNALLGAASIAVITGLTFAWFGPVAAVVAGLLGALYRPFLFYTAPLMKEPLALFLLSLFLLFMTRAVTKKRPRDYAYAGAALGLCALVRGNVLVFMPLVLAFGFWKERRAFLKPAAAFLIALLLCIAPATIHNYVVSKDFVLTNYTDGFNLYIGNSPSANGTNTYPPEVSTDPVQEEMTTVWVAQQAMGRQLKPSEVSAYWRGRAVDFMIENPGRTLELVINKILAFWNGAEKFDNYDIGFIEKNFGTLLVLPLPTYLMVTVLAAFGAVAGWTRFRQPVALLCVMIGTYMATCALFYVTDRYRLPAVIFLLPLAGAAFPAAGHLIASKSCKRWAATLCAVAVFLFLGSRPDPDAVDLTAYNWGTLSMIYADMGRDHDSIKTLEKAILISPVEAGAAAYVRGSYALENLGENKRAQNLLERALKVYPDNGIVWYNYGRFLAAHGWLKDAMWAFNKGVTLSPSYLLNYYALAKGYGHQGDTARAIEIAKRGLTLDPSDPLLNDMLSQLLQTPSGTKP